MNTYQITLLPENRQLQASHGDNLQSVLQKAGCPIDAPCGGNGKCGKCHVLVDGHMEAACHLTVERDMTVVLPQKEAIHILQEKNRSRLHTDGEFTHVLAFDIGTTTVACALLDGKTGITLAQCGAPNPQIRFGADVISRLRYVLENGIQAPRDSILETLSALTLEAAQAASLNPAQIPLAAIAGNTAMHHLLLGIDPAPLTHPPYMPAAREAMVLPAAGLLPIHPEGQARILPNIAGFVGGDTVGCLCAAHFDLEEELTLLIDVGTNAEMVLGDRHRRIACSAAAGPAFEGVGISQGMHAANGAIDRVTLEAGQLRYHTIGQTEATGLCGSGLLDLIAVLLETGEISGSGLLKENTFCLPGSNVALTRKDVRQVQLAKSAVRSGIELMCHVMGVTPEQIRKVYLAGAFGNYLDPASACRIGMIPPILQGRIHAIGNAALTGITMCALSGTRFEAAKKMAAETEFLELASLPQFQDCFVDNLLFEDEE